MKKFLALGLLALLFVALQFMVPTNPVPVDNDVGITCTISDYQSIQTPVITMPESIQIARGVSVPDKYLITDAIIFDDEISYECNVYYTISRTDYKPDKLAGYPNSIDKYPFASDLGLRQS